MPSLSLRTAAYHVTTRDTNVSIKVQSTNNFRRSQTRWLTSKRSGTTFTGISSEAYRKGPQNYINAFDLNIEPASPSKNIANEFSIQIINNLNGCASLGWTVRTTVLF